VLAGSAAAQNKFKLGMAVGGEAASNCPKARAMSPAPCRSAAGIVGEQHSSGDRHEECASSSGRCQRRHRIQWPALGKAVMAAGSAAGIPVVTYDIAQKGFYFVGIDNLAAGIAGGEGLGKIAKEKWNCDVDLVLSSEGAGAGIVNEWRTGGMRTGLKNICPDIAPEKYISFEGSGQVSVAAPAARDVLAAHRMPRRPRRPQRRRRARRPGCRTTRCRR
jgi:hypothetical protein